MTQTEGIRAIPNAGTVLGATIEGVDLSKPMDEAT
jgi:hypothetical protein